MKQEAYLRIIASIIITLVISLPFYTSSVFAEEDGIPYDVSYIQQLDVPDSPEACIAKHEQTNELVEMFDNELISKFTNLIALITAICSVRAAIGTMHAAITTVLGHPLSPCCPIFILTSVECAVVTGEKIESEITLSPIDVICCIATCGWYYGECGLGFGGTAISGFVKAGQKAGIIGVDPDSSIYAAVLCPPAMLTHIKRLKLIYQTYNCCVKEACNNGLSTESCEKQLDFQTCVFWEGGAVKTIINVVITVIFLVVAIVYGEAIGKAFATASPVLSCLLSWYQVINIPLSLTAMLNTIQNLGKSFDEPECKDLGFDTYAEYIPEPVPRYYRLEDTDGDGRYDLKEEISPPGKASEDNAITGAVVGAKITGMVESDADSKDIEIQLEKINTRLAELEKEDYLASGASEDTTGIEKERELLLEKQKDLLQGKEEPSLLKRVFGGLGFGKKEEKPAEEKITAPPPVKTQIEDKIKGEEPWIAFDRERYGKPIKWSWSSILLTKKTRESLGEKKDAPPQIEPKVLGATGVIDKVRFTYIAEEDGKYEVNIVAKGKDKVMIGPEDDKYEIAVEDGERELTEKEFKKIFGAPPLKAEIKRKHQQTGEQILDTVKKFAMIYLGPIIDEKIDEMCQSKLDSSEPESQTPSSQTVGPTEFTEDYCYTNPSITTVTAQASKSDDTYTYSYSAVSCKQDLNIQVKLENSRLRILDAVFLSKGTVVQKSSHVNDTHTFTDICVYTDDDEVGEDGVLCSAITGVS